MPVALPVSDRNTCVLIMPIYWRHFVLKRLNRICNDWRVFVGLRNGHVNSCKKKMWCRGQDMGFKYIFNKEIESFSCLNLSLQATHFHYLNILGLVTCQPLAVDFVDQNRQIPSTASARFAKKHTARYALKTFANIILVDVTSTKKPKVLLSNVLV